RRDGAKPAGCAPPHAPPNIRTAAPCPLHAQPCEAAPCPLRAEPAPLWRQPEAHWRRAAATARWLRSSHPYAGGAASLPGQKPVVTRRLVTITRRKETRYAHGRPLFPHYHSVTPVFASPSGALA